MKWLLFLVVLVLLGGCSSGSAKEQGPLHPEPQDLPTVAGQVLYKAPITPRHLLLPRIEARVIPLRLEGSQLNPPSDPQVLGWWGRPACASHGVTLLLGHTVHKAAWDIYGKGALDNLEKVKVGTDVRVSGCNYAVTSNRIVSKTYVKNHAASLFNQKGKPALVVVTCEGYDPKTGHYSQNVVLVAKPV